MFKTYPRRSMLLFVFAMRWRRSRWDYILEDRLALKLRHVRHAESIANDGVQFLRLQMEKNSSLNINLI